MNLPRDPYILYSVINMKLRDSYASLDALCDDLGESKAEISEILNNAGFFYNSKTNSFYEE